MGVVYNVVQGTEVSEAAYSVDFGTKGKFDGLFKRQLKFISAETFRRVRVSDEYDARLAEIAAFRSSMKTVVAFDAEHLVHLYTRQTMIPMLRAAKGGTIFIDHADKIISEGFDPIGRFVRDANTITQHLPNALLRTRC